MTKRLSLSSTAIVLVLGLAAPPIAAQQADGVAELITRYPALAAIEDQSCLKRLAKFEADAGDGALADLVDGKATAAEFADAASATTEVNKKLSECLLTIEAEAQATGTVAAAPVGGESAPPAETAEAPADEAPETPAATEQAQDQAAPASEDAGDRSAEAASADEELAKDTAEGTTGNEEAPKTTGESTAETDSTDDRPAGKETREEARKARQKERAEARKARQEAAREKREARREAAKEAREERRKERAGRSDEEDAAADTRANAEDSASDADASSQDDKDTNGQARDDGKDEEKTADGDKPADAEEAAKASEDAVQEDTEAATEAANETVTVEASGSADAAKAEDVEKVTVTEETARKSSEDFTTPANRGGRKQASGDDGPGLGEVAAGVLGGVLLNELLRTDEEVAASTGDRVVIRRGAGDYYVLKDESALLRRPGAEFETQRFSDGSLREIVTRRNGVRVETIRSRDGRVVRRERIFPDGRSVVLFDDTERVAPVEIADLPPPRKEYVEFSEDMDAAALRQRIAEKEREARLADRRFSLRQVRDIRAVRNLVPTLQLETINFETGSAAIRPSEAEELAAIGRAMRLMIEDNPYEVFLIEGHTDAVGSAAFNLALSDRRAESVALALTEYFDVAPENMIVQGYGESDLRIDTDGPERLNRRAAVRRVTPLLNSAGLQ